MNERGSINGSIRSIILKCFDVGYDEISPVVDTRKNEYLDKHGYIVMKMTQIDSREESTLVAPLFLVVENATGPAWDYIEEEHKDKDAFTQDFLWQQAIKLANLFWSKPENQEETVMKCLVFIAPDNHFIAVSASSCNYDFKGIVRIEPEDLKAAESQDEK